MSLRRFLPALLLLAGCGSSSIDPKDQVALGAAFASKRNCAVCHQSDDGALAGQTRAISGTMAFGSNLTPDRTTGLGGWADLEIVRAMRFGVDNQEQPVCPPHPHATDMTDLEANAIVAYLRSLAPVERAIPASKCPPLKPPPPVDMAMPPPLDQPDLSMPIDLGGFSD